MLLYADQLPADRYHPPPSPLLLPSSNSKNRFLFHRKFSLDTCRFEDNGPSNVPFSFVIANAQKSFAVFADSQESKDEWLSGILFTPSFFVVILIFIILFVLFSLIYFLICIRSEYPNKTALFEEG